MYNTDSSEEFPPRTRYFVDFDTLLDLSNITLLFLEINLYKKRTTPKEM